MNSSRAVLILLLGAAISDARALEWITLAPNPAYTRDLAMGGSTVALTWSPQSQSINPAGLSLFDPRTEFHSALFLNPGGLWQISRPAAGRTTTARVLDYARLVTAGGALQRRIILLAALLSQPVMDRGDTTRYVDFSERGPLDYHQNSLLLSLAVHPRVSIGGRMDRYYRWDVPQGDAFSYGVILRPRGVRVGVQYQRYPASGVRHMHPLDRRSGETTNIGVAVDRRNLVFSVQVMNLTQSDQPAFLEPHAGLEWRPVRTLALRAGGTQFSRSNRWAWTAGFGLFDANWLRDRRERLLKPDEILQAAVGVIYERRVPVQAMTSVTCVIRF